MRLTSITLAIVALIAAAFWFAASPYGEKSQDVQHVQIGTFSTAIDYAPYIIAKRKGWIDEALKTVGAEAEYLPTFQSLPTVNEAIATDRLDIVLTGEVPTIIGRAAGIDIKIAWLSCRLNADTVIPVSSTAKSIVDLKGKRIAVLAGSAPYYWVVRNLEKNGLSKQDVIFLDMPPPDAKAAFETGAVDAWSIFPPWGEQEVVAGRGKTLPGFKAPIQVVVAVRGQFAKEHSKELTAVLSALDRAKEWLQKNPEEAQQIVQEEIDLPLPVVKLSWTKLDWSASFDSVQSQETANFLEQQGFVKKIVDVHDLLLSGVEKK